MPLQVRADIEVAGGETEQTVEQEMQDWAYRADETAILSAQAQQMRTAYRCDHCKPLIEQNLLVAGARFELATFGL